ncbi:MAG: ABC transporter ATP-binding protein [Desulfococcaceae bacterium]
MKTPSEKKLLLARGLSKTYRGASHPALEHLDISLEPGEIFGLLGPNGAGKTTAISLMSSLLAPDSGTVTVCGLDMFTQSRKVRKLIGLVPQDIALYPSLSARENLMYFGRLYGMGREELRNSVRESLEMTGLTDRADDRICTYSGGMKRRANLAAGILHGPKVIFLDEPTVGIDAQSRNMILEKLLILKEKGTAMIYTTHYMEEAERLCTRAAIMDEGRIVIQGNPPELIRQHPECSSLGEVFLALTGKQLRD